MSSLADICQIKLYYPKYLILKIKMLKKIIVFYSVSVKEKLIQNTLGILLSKSNIFGNNLYTLSISKVINEVRLIIAFWMDKIRLHLGRQIVSLINNPYIVKLSDNFRGHISEVMWWITSTPVACALTQLSPYGCNAAREHGHRSISEFIFKRIWRSSFLLYSIHYLLYILLFSSIHYISAPYFERVILSTVDKSTSFIKFYCANTILHHVNIKLTTKYNRL